MYELLIYDEEWNPIENFWQYDYGIKIIISKTDAEITQIQFSNKNRKKTIDVYPWPLGDGYSVLVPDELLQDAIPLHIYAVYKDNDTSFTTKEVIIPVIAKPDSGYETIYTEDLGIKQSKIVNPSTEQIIVTADEGYNGLSKVIVNPINDINLQPENIRQDVSIFGVAGNYAGSEYIEEDTLNVNGSIGTYYDSEELELTISPSQEYQLFSYKTKLNSYYWDLDEDGNVDNADLVLAARWLNGDFTPVDSSVLLDLDGDGVVTQNDVNILASYITGQSDPDDYMIVKIVTIDSNGQFVTTIKYMKKAFLE